MDKLKPCPFCGHEAMISYNSNYDFQAYCTNDACFMSQIIMEDMETEEQAREAWNKRAHAVPAVPLDKLCEWLSESSVNFPCTCCKNFVNECCYCTANWDEGSPCPNSADDWRQAITKWMEEQDAQTDQPGK